MPSAALRPCLHPTCAEPATYKGRCRTHARVQEQARYNADTRKWYSTQSWRTLRLLVLTEQPTCMDCHHAPSTEVDHIAPHRGQYVLFWDKANLQGLCQSCHSAKTRRGQ